MEFTVIVIFFLYVVSNNIKITKCSGSLESMNDDDLLNLIRTENYVSVLFSKFLPLNINLKALLTFFKHK